MSDSKLVTHPIVSKSKAGLILDQPFFASLLLGMPLYENNSDNNPTMSTDGESIHINTNWIDTLKLPEVTFVLAHEVLHCVFQHMLRLGDRDHDRWNVATDYIINDLLVNDNVGTMPKIGLLNPQLVKQGGGTADGVYALLANEPKKKPGEPGGPMDQLLEPGQTPSQPKPGQAPPRPGQGPGGQARPDEATLNQKSAEMRVKVVQAANAAKMQGKLSAGMDRLVKELVRVETDWRTVLRQFFSERAKIDLSYAKPKRRFLAEDIYLPSQVGEKLGPIAVAVDCSGSIDIETLGKFEKEIQGIIQDTKPTSVKVIYFDAKVLRTETFGPDDEVKLKPTGGGGTMFSPIWPALQDDELKACVVLTDLYCNDFGNQPDYPVLWACTESKAPTNPPFGEVTYLKRRS